MSSINGNGSTRCETVIIGGGQAGLATAYHLTQRGASCVVLDHHERIGDNWRRHWDSLKLYSPARYDGLPGMPFPADDWSFPTKDEVANYLETYADHFDLPVLGGVTVQKVTKADDRYVIDAGDRQFEADNVVVATGTFGKPHVPEFASELDEGILQLHSSEYQRLSQLKDGAVLVVGASHSGGDIAYEAATAHETVLCGRSTGEIPFDIESRLSRMVFPLLWFAWNHVLTVKTPIGRKLRPDIRNHGGPLLRVKGADLAAAGVERLTSPVAGVYEGKPMLEDGRVLDVTTVVWCTGFRQDFRWIRLPIVGSDGWPLERRGVVADAPGLYFVGLAFQRAFASMLIGGAGIDAEHVADHITARRATQDATTEERRAAMR